MVYKRLKQRKGKTMKHTTFENELNEIRRRAINELKEAIKAYGFSINFYQNDEEVKLPKAMATVEYINADGTMKVWLDRNFMDNLSKYIKIEDLAIEDILAITEAIPESDEVEDVSGVYPVPVTWVDRDDIEINGFDSRQISQEKLKEIAEQMQDYYCASCEFSSNLYDACLACGLKEKED